MDAVELGLKVAAILAGAGVAWGLLRAQVQEAHQRANDASASAAALDRRLVAVERDQASHARRLDDGMASVREQLQRLDAKLDRLLEREQ